MLDNTKVLESTQESNNGLTKFIKSFLAGGLSSSLATSLMAPIERIKLILQIQSSSKYFNNKFDNSNYYYYNGLRDALIRIPKEQGYLSFWRGNWASVIRSFPYMALNFALRDKFKDYFNSNNRQEGIEKNSSSSSSMNNFWWKVVGNLLCGGLAGSTAMALIYPLDYARTRMAMDLGHSPSTREFTSMSHCLKSAFKTNGFFGLYRGFSFSIIGVFIYRGTYFGLFDTGKDLLLLSLNQNHENTTIKIELNLLSSLLVAEFAAIISGLLSYPFDTVRRSLMVLEYKKSKCASNNSTSTATSTKEVFKRIMERKGLRGFYNGGLTNVLRGTGGALMLVLYDQIQEFW